MSLNGLEAPNVNEAYQAALSEAGGWLLLQYISRDEVSILKAGGGGISEAREAISQYDAKSPIYGFIQYRRRKVLLKYIPDGTSRLLQARVAVHFQAVIEKFTPYDTVFSMSASADLNDAALTSACKLHTASIMPSSGSLRRRELAGIAEVSGEQRESAFLYPGNFRGEDNIDSAREQGDPALSPNVTDAATSFNEDSSRILSLKSPNASSSPKKGQFESSKTKVAELKQFSQPLPPTPAHIITEAGMSPTALNIDKALPATPPASEPEKTMTNTFVRELDHGTRPSIEKFDLRPSMDRRPSVQSTRSTARDIYSMYGYKPKIRLGPRPSLDSSGRPQSPGSHSRPNEPRPVSSLPASVRMPVRRSAPLRPSSQQSNRPSDVSRPQSQRSNQSQVPSYNTPLSPPVLPAIPVSAPVRSDMSSLDMFGLLDDKNQASDTKPPTMTPEKQRLMKALQLRKKQMAMHKENERRHPDFEDLAPANDADSRKEKADPEDGSVTSECYIPLAVDPDLIRIANADIGEGPSVNPEASPVFLLDPSDGLSTQASSIAEEQITSAEDGKETSTSSTETLKNVGDLASSASPNVPMFGTSAIPSITEPITTQNIGFSTTYVDPTISDEPIPSEVPLPSIDEYEQWTLSAEGEAASKLSQSSINPPISTPGIPYNDASVPISRDSIDADSHADSIRPSLTGTSDRSASLRHAQRRPKVDSSQRASSVGDSDDNYLSDDSLVEELKSATVQEAKPISMSKSPASPRSPKDVVGRQIDQTENVSRAASSPLELALSPGREHEAPEVTARPLRRIVSTPSIPEITAAPTPMSKRANVSSGISQRIKALEKLRSREPSPVPQMLSPGPSPTSAPSTAGLRKSSLSRLPFANDSSKNLSPRNRTENPYPSPSSSPEATISARRSENSKSFSLTNGKARPDSVSVTATIIRHPGVRSPGALTKVHEPAVGFVQSPLVVKHQTSSTNQHQSEKSLTRIQEKPAKSSRPSSVHSSTSEPKRNSLTSKHSSSSRKGNAPNFRRSISDTSSSGLASLDEQQEEKPDSKKNKLFKRMSSNFSASRRSIASALNPSPTVKEEPIIEHHEPTSHSLPQCIEVGDVNIQFPDTLLWKRRQMNIDQKGNLILSPSKADAKNARLISKQYHLSTFRTPYIPDQDSQELPNSVTLDFNDGSTLQCAAQNTAGQMQLLNSLKEAHRAYT